MSELRKGDIVLNGYQEKPYNTYLIMGTTTRKTGKYSNTKYYKTRHIIHGKLLDGDALFSQSDNKLAKIGHVNIPAVMSAAISNAIEQNGDK